MARKPIDNFTKLKIFSREIALFSSCASLAGWDRDTNMSPDGNEFKAEVLELLGGYIQKQSTSKKFERLLKAAESDKTLLTEAQKRALKLWRRDFDRAKKLPLSFVKKITRVTSKAQTAWVAARDENSFKAFAPHLEKIVKLCKERAAYYGTTSGNLYDALLDEYEPGMTVEKLTPIFANLKEVLPPLIKAFHSKTPADKSFLKGPFEGAKQIELGKLLMDEVHLPHSRCTLGESAHPFCCEIHPTDIRQTTHVHENNLLASIFAVLHESGHSLYHSNLPVEHYGTPLCAAASYGIDESQSRLYETIIGHGKPFWNQFYPKLQNLFPVQLESVSQDAFYRAIHTQPITPIRIYANELCYCMHIILRFELEQGLINGTIKIKDLPKLWAEKMKEYLGITPESDAKGVLQDVHWSMGAIGYFPTYALGNLYAAQIFETFQAKYPSWTMESLLAFLKENIQSQGSLYTPDELILRVTGKPLSAEPYINYLKTKYENL